MISGRLRACSAMLVIVACGAASCGRRAARVSAPAAPARIGAEETGIASWYGVPYHGRRTASGEIYDMEKLTAAHRSLPFQTWVEVTNLENGKRVDVRINDRGPFVRGRVIDLSQHAAREIEMLGPGVVKVRLKVIAPPKDLPSPTEFAKDNSHDALVQSTNPAEANQNPGEQTNDGPASRAKPAIAAKPPPEPSPPAMEREPPARTGTGYAVQAGAFVERERAESLRSKLAKEYMDARVVLGTDNLGTSNLWRVIVGRQMTREQAVALANRVRKDTGATLLVPEPD
jgi:peptidoglycan lytic transglycosylase